MEKIIPWFGASDIGRQRQSNQDCFAAFPELGLWVLCDGMGGHAAGAAAAGRAVAMIEAEIRAGQSLTAAVESAHRAVIGLGDELQRDDKESRRPGSTVVALRVGSAAADIDNSQTASYEIVWVGDSRA
jgi:protein phosphatase